MSDEIFDDDGLTVTAVNRRAMDGQRMVEVDVTVIGGNWPLSESSVRRLISALAAWVEKGDDEA